MGVKFDAILGKLRTSDSSGIGSLISDGTTGSILFVGSGSVIAQNNASLFWDNTNNKIIIRGKSGQSDKLQEWQDSSNNVLSSVGPAGQFIIGSAILGTGTAPLSVNASSSHATYLLQMGKNSNFAYFRIDQNGNINDIGGNTARIQNSAGKPYFPDGLVVQEITSASDANAIFSLHVSATYPFAFTSGSDARKSLVAKGFSSTMTENVFEVDDQSFNILFSVSYSAIVLNEIGRDLDTRIEGDTDVNLVFVDASADTVQIGATTTVNSAKFYVAGISAVKQGTSSSAARLGGSIFDHFTDANNGTTVETDLYSDTLVASSLGTNGDKIRAQYGGTFSGAVASTQELRAYFGGTLIFDSGALSIGAATDSWNLFVSVIRVSSSVVRCLVTLTTNFATLSSYATYTEVTGLTLSNTQILKITGQAAGAGALSNQITAKEGFVQWLSAA